MRKRKELSSELRDLLKEVVARSCPDLLGSLDLDPLSIPKKDRWRIQEALAREIGVDEHGNIDVRGRQIDELISYIWSQPLADEYEQGLPEEPMQ